MTNPVYRRDTCRLCGGRDLELVFQLAPTPIGTDYVSAERVNETQETYPIDLFLCLDCGYAGLIDVVAPELLFNESEEITSMSLGVVENLRQLSEFVANHIKPANGSLVVDIGSNDGTLLNFFKQQGMRVLGVEPAHYAAHKALEYGIKSVSSFFAADVAQRIADEHGPASVITATRVFANIDDLDDITTGIRSLLTPDGVFVFETGYLVDILENMLFETIYHEHLSYDSVKPLDSFFKNRGMELIDVEGIPIKGGSLRGVVQLAGGPRQVSPSVTKMIDHETSLGYDGVQPFKVFSDKLNNVQDRLSKLLGDLKQDGKVIAGYGASVGSTTMIYHYGLGDLLSYIVDDDPRHQNLFTPGHHIPVFPPDVIYEKNPDYVLILAWRYAEPIIKKHPVYLEQGGRFVVPLPEVRVISSQGSD